MTVTLTPILTFILSLTLTLTYVSGKTLMCQAAAYEANAELIIGGLGLRLSPHSTERERERERKIEIDR
jgi:hypothetical protein